MVLMNENKDVELDFKKAPSYGERIAISGYFPQHVISSELIIESIRNRSLKSFTVADPKAGTIDDLVLIKENRIDAYQFKWSRPPDLFTYADLLTKNKDKPSLLNQLAQGWKKLSAFHTDQKVYVHLVTCDIPSKKITATPLSAFTMSFTSFKPPKSFADFISEIWTPIERVDTLADFQIPDEWKQTWECFINETGLSQSDFELFIKQFELEFNYKDSISNKPATKNEANYQNEIKELYFHIDKSLAGNEKEVTRTVSELFDLLGWGHYLNFRSKHEFPVDEVIYQHIDETNSKIQDTIDSFTGGYIALLGSPGSGKSSLLTKLSLGNKHRLVKYYAHIPESTEYVLRGESENFLHDIVKSIEDHGFTIGKSINSYDSAELQIRLQQQLQDLSNDYKNTGTKTVIVIDGLDHVLDGRKPERSFLDDLFEPTAIPEGVYVILGTQTLNILYSSIRHSIQQENRAIEISHLSENSTTTIINKFDLPFQLSSTHKDEVIRLSEGHPLELMYLLMDLKEINDINLVDKFLTEQEQTNRNPDNRYLKLWERIDNDLRDCLKLICRCRNMIDLKWVETWAGEGTTKKLYETTKQYFKNDRGDYYYFYHNSFKRYLIRKTAESYKNEFDEQKNKDAYYELAKKCEKETKYLYPSWDLIFYLKMTGRNDEIIKTANVDYFEDQFINCRSDEAIHSDINLALVAAYEEKDIAKFLKLIFLGMTFSQRGSRKELETFIPLLVKLDKPHCAIDYIRNGNNLLLYKDLTFKLSIDLSNEGLKEEAKRIYDLSSSFNIIKVAQDYQKTGQPYRLNDFLSEWSKALVYFETNIETVINKVEVAFQELLTSDILKDWNDKTMTREDVFELIASHLLYESQWDNFKFLLEKKDIIKSYNRLFRLYSHACNECICDKDFSRANIFLEKLKELIPYVFLDNNKIIELAEHEFHLGKDRDSVLNWIKYVSQPELRTNLYSNGNQDFRAFKQRLKLNRLLYSLGYKSTEKDIIPEPSNDKLKGLVRFERGICTLSYIWSKVWRSLEVDEHYIDSKIPPILKLFNLDFMEKQDLTSMSSIDLYAKEGFYEHLIYVFSLLGKDKLSKLAQMFEAEWTNILTKQYWEAALQRSFILEFHRYGIPTDWCIKQLSRVEELAVNISDAEERTSECLLLTDAYTEIGETQLANNLFDKTLKSSFGLNSRKDYQLDEWTKLLEMVCESDKQSSKTRIEWFAKGLVKVDQESGNNIYSSALELVEITFKVSPRSSILLAKWMFNEGILSYISALILMLKLLLKTNNPPLQLVLHCLLEIILPISEEASNELIQSLFSKIYQQCGKKETINLALYFLQKNDIYSIDSARKEWKKVIGRTLYKLEIDINELDIQRDNLFTEKDKTFGTRIELDDKSNLFQEEIEKEFHTFNDIKELIDKNPKSTSLLIHVIEGAIKNLSYEDIKEVCNTYKNNDDFHRIALPICKRLVDLGYKDYAWEVGSDAYKTSKGHGWIFMFDGGSRTNSLEALRTSYSERVPDLAFKTLKNDLINHSIGKKQVAENFHKVIPLLTNDVPIKEIWKEIEDYLGKIFNASYDPSLKLEIFTKDFEKDTPILALYDLLSYTLEHPVSSLSQGTKRVYGKLILEREPTVSENITKLLVARESIQEHVLIILDSVSLINVDYIKDFSTILTDLTDADNFVIRQVARELCKRIGATLKTKTLIAPLNETYELMVTSEQGISEDFEPYDYYLELMSTLSNVPFANICHRAKLIRNDLEENDFWSRLEEKRLRSLLNSMGLRFPFIKPMARLNRRACFHVAAELTDNKAIAGSKLQYLIKELRFYDPSLVLNVPIVKPKEIKSITHQHGNEDWIKDIPSEKDKIMLDKVENRYVIGEYTKINGLQSDSASEARLSTISANTHEAIDIEKDVFCRVPNTLIKEYPLIKNVDASKHIILHHLPYWYETPSSKWLALNPSVGIKLNWQLSSDGLFKWLDKNGNTMVESIWWMDGNCSSVRYSFSDEYSEGWIVLATKEAIIEMSKHFDVSKKYIKIKRKCHDRKGNEIENEESAILNFSIEANAI